MNPILISVVGVVLLAIYVLYKRFTLERALDARDSLADAVGKLVSDPETGKEAKGIALGMFACSMQPTVIPGVLVWALVHPHSVHKGTRRMRAILPERDKERIDAIFKEHFLRVHFWAGPHWAVVSILLFLATFVVYWAFNRGHAGYRALLGRIRDIFLGTPPTNSMA